MTWIANCRFTSILLFQCPVMVSFESPFKSYVYYNSNLAVIGADIIDPTNQNNAHVYGKLNEEPAYFELSPNQQVHWDTLKKLNQYLRDEHHSLRDFLWRKDTRALEIFNRNIPPPEIERSLIPDACRLHGVLTVNKVGGNLHVTIGKHLPIGFGHAHISLFTDRTAFNFSHRIEKFSFGTFIPSIINPLEGDEKVTPSTNTLYQYFIKVVSTDVQTSDLKTKTYQYSVTQKEREIDHSKGSHGTPGIHFKYEIDAIAVKVVEESVPLSILMIRICGIIGGVYATSGFFASMTSILIDIVTCKYVKHLRISDI